MSLQFVHDWHEREARRAEHASKDKRCSRFTHADALARQELHAGMANAVRSVMAQLGDGSVPIVMGTAYDSPARLVDHAAADDVLRRAGLPPSVLGPRMRAVLRGMAAMVETEQS